VTPEDIAWLRSPEGATATRLATERLQSGDDELRVIEALRRSVPPEQARAALGLAIGRSVAATKFSDAADLFCDRETAEQASSELAAHHSAQRFAGLASVADLGCGMGGDLLEIAAHSEVVAVDRDTAHLAMAESNTTVRGLAARVRFVAADLEIFGPADQGAAWLDPSRRDSGGRRLDPERWSPPLSVAIEVGRRFPGAGLKLAPGIERALLPADGELEFVSLDGRLVEAVLWLGTLARTARRATILGDDGTFSELSGDPDDRLPEVAPVGSYLYDPDPAVGRAQLIRHFAADIEAWQLDARVAYLSADRAVSTPFARRFRVLASAPFSERQLLEELMRLEAGRVEVMRRGSPIETNELATRLDRRLHGDQVLTVALTRVGSESVAIICERERDQEPG
jgi:SAM-dependent methyltransferase